MGQLNEIYIALTLFELIIYIAAVFLHTIIIAGIPLSISSYGSNSLSSTTSFDQSQPPSVAHRDLIIALLSIIILGLRYLLALLAYLPRCGSIVYDMILLCIWSCSFATHVSASYTGSINAGLGRHPELFGNGDENLGALARARLAIFVAAITIHTLEVLVEVLEMVLEMTRGFSEESGLFTMQNVQCLDEESMVVEQEALSPVLAFYPED